MGGFVRALLRGGGRGRLRGVDAARGVALLGMMAIHVLPDRDPDGTTSTAYTLAYGRAAATFAVLAGVGLALATARVRSAPRPDRDWRGVAAALTVRAAAIGAIGLLLGYLDSGVAVILAYYGLFFVLTIPLLRLGPRTLGGLALAIAILLPIGSFAIRDGLPSPFRSNPTFASLTDPVELLTVLTITGYYPVLPWMAYLCAGLAVGMLPLRSTRVAGWLLGGGLLLAVGARLISRLLLNVLDGREQIAATLGLAPDSAALSDELTQGRFGNVPTTTWWWLAVDAPHSTTPLDLLHTIGVALAVLGLGLLVARVTHGVLIPLAAAGSMTLTLYTAHVWGLSTGLLPADPYTSYLLQVIIVLAFAGLWWFTRSRGPIEDVIARLAGLARRSALAAPRRP